MHWPQQQAPHAWPQQQQQQAALQQGGALLPPQLPSQPPPQQLAAPAAGGHQGGAPDHGTGIFMDDSAARGAYDMHGEGAALTLMSDHA